MYELFLFRVTIDRATAAKIAELAGALSALINKIIYNILFHTFDTRYCVLSLCTHRWTPKYFDPVKSV